MGLAQYAVVAAGDRWGVLHDGNVEGDFATKESPFESAIAAASLAIREGHGVLVGVPGRVAGNRPALGAKDSAWYQLFPVMAGLDLAIHLLEDSSEEDGC